MSHKKNIHFSIYHYCYLFTILLLIGFNGWAQEVKNIQVVKDPRIDLLVKKSIENNEFNTRDARRFVQGYRLLIINTPDRNQANEARLKLLKVFPDLKSYMEFQSPRFRVKAGNFKDQKEGEGYLKRLQPLFTQEIYLIRDVVEINPDKSSTLEKQ